MDNDHQAPRKRVIFDPTINLGHIVTMLSVITAGVAFAASIERRVGVLEEKEVIGGNLAKERQQATAEQLKEMRSDIKELQRGINDINRAVAGRTYR